MDKNKQKNQIKIGIFTHYYKSINLGGLLQAYALVCCLQNKLYYSQQISFNFYKYDSEAILIFKKLFPYNFLRKMRLKNIKNKIIKIIEKCYMYVRVGDIGIYLDQQNVLFEKFRTFIPHTQVIYTNSTVKRIGNSYNVCIVGSDQVWTPSFLPFSPFVGHLDNLSKCITYAASSSVKQFTPKVERYFIQELANFTSISVREKTLKEYIERITPYKATVVLDPTFLLSPQEWLKIANPTTLPQKPYIFCYFLGGKSAWQRKIAQAYADKYGYEVVHLPYIMQSIRLADRFLKGQGRYDVGPREFIALINGAQCVFTDSFHGLAFSINFGKNFYVFNRDDQAGPQSMNARIIDTLATFGLTSRHITDKNAILDNKPLDFTEARQILAQEKQRSINWLLNALKD